MPHLIVEHSANLSKSHDMQALADCINEAVQTTGIFPLAGIRVRLHPSQICSIADGHPDNAFVAIIMRIGAGRDLATRQRGGQAVFDAVCDFFKTEMDSGFMAVSLDIEINDPDMSLKKNGIRTRLDSAK